jgi:hypothetical protein
MLRRVTATLQGHPWDLWGLSQLFDGSDSSKMLVVAAKPTGRPTFDVTDPNQVTRFRIHGYDVSSQLTSDALVLDDTKGDLRDLKPTVDEIISGVNGLARTFDPMFTPVRLIHLSYPTENGAASMTAGDWTPNRDSTLLTASAHRDLAVQALRIAASNPAVSFVLDAMTLPPTWASLYLVYDAISTHVGGQHELKKFGWLTDDQLNDLTNSANNSRSIIEGARHGNKPKPTRPLISLDIARILTSQIIAQWFYQLIDQGK